jgi:hypothetical protein
LETGALPIELHSYFSQAAALKMPLTL